MEAGKTIEYVVVNEGLLGYRTPGATTVQSLSAPGSDHGNTQHPVQMAVDAVRPATAADFAQYRVALDGYEADLSKPLIRVLEHHLTENVPLDRLDPEAVARELRERTLEYAWATRKTPEVLLCMAEDLVAKDESSSERRYVVYSPTEAENDGAGYWSNEDGWVKFDHADWFSESEKLTLDLPTLTKDAIWTEADMTDALPNEEAAQNSREPEGGMLFRNED